MKYFETVVSSNDVHLKIIFFQDQSVLKIASPMIGLGFGITFFEIIFLFENDNFR